MPSDTSQEAFGDVVPCRRQATELSTWAASDNLAGKLFLTGKSNEAKYRG